MATTSCSADRIVKALEDRRYFSDDKIAGYLSENGYLDDKDDLLAIITSMAQRGNMFSLFIESRLLTVATSSPGFVNLVSELGRRNLWPISKLFELHKQDSSAAEYLYSELDRLADVKLSTAMGFTLGGGAIIEPNRLFELIESNPNAPIHEKIAFMVALKTSLRKDPIPDSIADFVLSSSHSDNAQLRYEATVTMMVAFGANRRFAPGLLELASEDVPEVQTIATFSGTLKWTDDFLVKLLQVCAKSKNPSTLSEVNQALGTLAPAHPIECLEILRSWHQRGIRGGIAQDWILQEIGKGNRKEVNDFLLTWIRGEKDVLVLTSDLPRYVSEIYKDHLEDFPGFLRTLNLKSQRGQVLAESSIEHLLSEMYDKLDRSKPFVRELSDVLMEIASRRRVDVAEATKGLNDPVMRSLAVIDALKHRVQEPDKKLARENLRYFPNLAGMLGSNWFEGQLEGAMRHPLISILSSARVSRRQVRKLATQFGRETDPLRRVFLADAIENQFYPSAFLADLNWALGMFQRTEQGMRRIVGGLRNKDEFFQTLSELQLAARLKTEFPVVLQHRVGNIPVDIKVTIGNQDYLIEVLGAESELRMKYVRTVLSLGNRAKDKILEKVDEQLKHVAEKTTLPLILAIDRSRSLQIDDADVQDALEGSVAMRFVLDKVKGELLGAHPIRKQDSVSDQNPETALLSGVLLVKEFVDGRTFEVRLRGKFYPNPRATRPLGQDATKSLENAVNR